MSERNQQSTGDDRDVERTEHDPDLGSTWNTIANTADIDDLMAEQEIEDFMSETPAGELGIIADTDVPGRPG